MERHFYKGCLLWFYYDAFHIGIFQSHSSNDIYSYKKCSLGNQELNTSKKVSDLKHFLTRATMVWDCHNKFSGAWYNVRKTYDYFIMKGKQWNYFTATHEWVFPEMEILCQSYVCCAFTLVHAPSLCCALLSLICISNVSQQKTR